MGLAGRDRAVLSFLVFNLSLVFVAVAPWDFAVLGGDLVVVLIEDVGGLCISTVCAHSLCSIRLLTMRRHMDKDKDED